MAAAIFDLDGTLVDLFDMHLRGFQAVMAADFGLEFTRADLAEYYGKTGEEIFGHFLSKNGISADVGPLAVRRRKWVVDNLRHCSMLPGAKRLVEGLRDAGFRLAVGTSNTPDLAQAILGACGLTGFFECVSCRDSKLRGKPSPDIFLAAAKELSARPSDCVVFEDSVFGVQAGKAAGMRVVAVATGTHSRRELAAEGPDLLADTLEEVGVESVVNLLS